MQNYIYFCVRALINFSAIYFILPVLSKGDNNPFLNRSSVFGILLLPIENSSPFPNNSGFRYFPFSKPVFSFSVIIVSF